MMQMNNAKRDKWVDFCRGIAIILVVAGHTRTLGGFNKIIYSFHMPLFFLISGFLYSEKNNDLSIRDFFQKTCKKYLFPYLCFALINIAIIIFMALIKRKTLQVSFFEHFFWGLVSGIDKYGWMDGWMQLWFLPAMAVTVILFYGIKKVKPCFLKTCLVLTTPLIGYMCFLFDIPKLIWNIDSATMLLPFLAFGYHVKKNFGKIASFMEKSKNISLAGLFFVSIAIGGMAASYNPARAGIVGFDYNTYGSFALTMIPAFLLSSVCFFGSFLLYVRCIDTVPIIRWTFRLIEWFGRNSLIVFGFDLFVNFVALKITETILIPRISVIFIKLLIDALIIETWTICKRHLTEVNAIWFAC